MSQGTVNKVVLIGNLGDDVKLHHFDDKNMIGRFPIATTETYNTREGEKVSQTEWHNVVVRNKLADICAKYVGKGDKVYIEGKLKTRKWDDQNGQTKYTTEVHANEVQFLNTKRDRDASSSNASATPEVETPNVEEDLPF